MDALTRLWQCLPAIRRFRFRAQSGQGSQTDWNGWAEGEVMVTRLDADELRFDETCCFTPAVGKPARMRNVYLWQRVEDGIALSHARRGETVHLLTLVGSPESDCLVPQAAHLCGQDCYQARLVLIGTGFTLDWQIQGPRKDESIAYHYF